MRRAFTMIEILIVISIIIVVLAVAIPAMNFIGGSKSTESAQNQISAFLGVARTDAIAKQKTAGVLFYINPTTSLITMLRVEDVGPATGAQLADVYLGISGVQNASVFTPDESITIPKGVGIEVVDDSGGAIGPPAVPANDRYIGFNNLNANPAAGGARTLASYGGVILFDGTGILTCHSYAFRIDPTATTGSILATTQLFYQNPDGTFVPNAADIVPVNPTAASLTNQLVMRSQLGLVLFDIDAFRNACSGDPLGDPLKDLQIEQPTATYTGSFEQQTKEAWLDTNGLVILINRYNGTLVKGE